MNANKEVVDGQHTLQARKELGLTVPYIIINSDDPLDAGLELLVSPPGKRLQSITLLSGGEQALTALSLIFAVFLSNPSPICVLDEVDAPLDDANVTRFCNLLYELTKITNTRFIIVTHHALTMSKMDRLKINKNKNNQKSQKTSNFGEAFKLSTELVAAVAVGTIIGFILDNWFGTKPWLILIFFFVGVIAGISNVIRSAKNMQK